MSKVTAKPAAPDRYVVDRIGTPDPADSQYFVLNVIYDFEARVALAKLGRRYQDLGQTAKAEELFAFLEGTTKAMGEMHARTTLAEKKTKQSKSKMA